MDPSPTTIFEGAIGRFGAHETEIEKPGSPNFLEILSGRGVTRTLDFCLRRAEARTGLSRRVAPYDFVFGTQTDAAPSEHEPNARLGPVGLAPAIG